MGVHDGHRERMRERFLKNGLEGFAEHEALELLLFYAIPQGNVNPLAHALIEEFGSLMNVLTAPVERLVKVKGVKERTAVLLRLSAGIARKARLEELEQETPLTSYDKLGEYLLELFSQERNEAVYMLCLDQKGKLLSRKRLGEGTASAVNLDVRKLAADALTASASAVVLAHNHPSGIALPSRDDINTTEQARTALETIGVKLADHIIVADGDFVSMADSGFFEGVWR